MSVLKPRTATKVLYQGDDMSMLSELKRAVDIAQRNLDQAKAQDGSDGASAARMDDGPSAVIEAAQAARDAAQEAFDAGVDEASERAVTVVLRSVGSRRFSALVAAHPPRMVDSEPDADGKTVLVEHTDDQMFGVNNQTFPLALLTFRDGKFATIAEPVLDSDDAVREFVEDDLAEGDVDEFWIAAFLLNRGPSADPKADAGSMSGSRSTAGM